MTRSTCIALAIAVLTCTSSARKAETHGDEAAGDPSAPIPSSGGKGSNGGSMSSPFKEALKRFQHEVASAYGKRADDLKIMPAAEDITAFVDKKTGDLIPFEATAPDLRVRGFASPSAVVIAKRNELGPLFQAARAADASASMSATDLAARVVWLFGPGFRVVDPLNVYPKRPLPPQVVLPAIERDGKGVVLRFFYVEDRDAHMGAPPIPFSAEVRCSPDCKTATLTTSPGP